MGIKAIILGGAMAIMAAPGLANDADAQKYSNCPVQIIEPETSAGYYLSKDCTTAFVLPPRSGQLLFQEYTSSIDDQVCQALEQIEDRNLFNEEFRTAIANAVATSAKKYNDLDKMIKNGDLPEGTTKEEVLAEMSTTLKELRDLKKDMGDDLLDYVQEKSPYALMEGGRGSFALVSGFKELMNDFVKLNEGKKITFKRMPVKKNQIAIVDAVFKGEEGKMEMRAVKRLLMAGHDLPVGNSVEAVANPEVAREVRGVQNSIFGEGIGGALEMSAIGDCAMRRALANDSDADPLRADISATGKYEYEVQVNRNYKVTYDFKELVHIIRESSKRGGFFSRKTVNKLIDERSTTTWITFHSSNNDTEYKYTEEDKKEIKKDFIDRALRQIVDVRSGGKASALALIDPSGKNGAQAIGDELGKCPHLYCQIGAAGFKVLDAIFGSETATSEVIKNVTGKSVEIGDENTMVTLTGTSVF